MNDNKKKKVSIILISKNVKKYIHECLNSLIKQTLNDIEILCVDAFSTDGTREIIQDYMKQDNRIRLIDDTKSSTGYANNIGIQEAVGEYIGFVEADDFVAADTYKVLYTIAKAENLDYIKADYIAFEDDAVEKRFYRKVKIFHEKSIYNRLINPLETSEVISNDMNTWTGLYESEFAKKYIHENETPGAAYQDMGFMLNVHLNAVRAKYIEEHFYYYRLGREGSSMTSARGVGKLCEEIRLNCAYLREKGANKSQWTEYYAKLLKSSIVKNIPKGLFINSTETEEINNLKTVDDETIGELCEFGKIIKQGLENGYIHYERNGLEQFVVANMLAHNVESYISYYYFYYKSLYEVQKSVVDKARNAKSVVIFGSGDSGQRLYKLLVEAQINNIIAYCDNNENIFGKKMFGIEVISPKRACEEYTESIFIIANQNHYDAIKDQLLDMGINRDRIYTYKIFE